MLGKKWYWIGYFGIIMCFILLFFYSVVGGWILIYIIKGFIGGLLFLFGFDMLFINIILNFYAVVFG